MIYCHLCQQPPEKKNQIPTHRNSGFILSPLLKNAVAVHFVWSAQPGIGVVCWRCWLSVPLLQEPSPRLGWTRHLSCSPSSPQCTDPLTSAGFTSSRSLMPLPDVVISVLQRVCFRATLESNILLTGVKGLITGKRHRHDNKGQSLWWRNAEVLSLLVSYLLQRLPRWHYAQPTSATGTLRSVTFSMYATALWGFFDR